LDKDRIHNEVTVSPGGQNALAQLVSDVDSQGVYGVRSLSKQTLLENEEDALAIAEVIVAAYADPRTRFERISVLEREDAEGWTEAVLGREIGDLVTVRTSPPVEADATPYTIEYACFIESIEDALSPGMPWQVSFGLTLQSEAVSGPPGGGGAGALLDSSGDTFTLDSATLGVLG
jgi:hypothetical protein